MSLRLLLAALLASAAVLGGAETGRAALEPSPLAPALETAAAQVEAAVGQVRSLPAGSTGPAARAAADALLTAAEAFRTVVAEYRATRPFGTLEEARLIEATARALLDARVDVGALAGESLAASSTDPARLADGLRSFITAQVVSRMGAEGLYDFLRQTRGDPRKALDRLLVNARTALVARVETQAEAAIRRKLGELGRLPIQLGVPLRDQLASYARTYVVDLLARVAFRLGPAGIVVQLLGGKQLVRIVTRGIESLFRNTGNWQGRTERTVRGFGVHEQSLASLAPGCVDRAAADRAVRAARRAIGAARYLEGDLRAGLEGKRRRQAETLLGSLLAAQQRLEDAILVTRAGCGIESPLRAADLAAALTIAERVVQELPALAARLGPPAVTLPTQAVCPGGFTMETFTLTGTKTGELPVALASFGRVYPTSDLSWKCVYGAVGGDPADEWFVVFYDIVPGGTPGAIASGDCDRARDDDLATPFLYSERRYLTVSGGSRKVAAAARGGNLAVIQQGLALAEAGAIGAACPLAPR